MAGPEENDHIAAILRKFAIELRILSNLGYRLEYALSEHLAVLRARQASADLQMLDMIIQSVDALELLAENLADQGESGAGVDLDKAAQAIRLKDMVHRLTGHDPPPAPAPPGDIGVELF